MRYINPRLTLTLTLTERMHVWCWCAKPEKVPCRNIWVIICRCPRACSRSAWSRLRMEVWWRRYSERLETTLRWSEVDITTATGRHRWLEVDITTATDTATIYWTKTKYIHAEHEKGHRCFRILPALEQIQHIYSRRAWDDTAYRTSSTVFLLKQSNATYNIAQERAQAVASILTRSSCMVNQMLCWCWCWCQMLDAEKIIVCSVSDLANKCWRDIDLEERNLLNQIFL